ncbi:MAG: hypothetical protein H7A55_03095 [Verrucomicrobiaceae bacterium]|nr:hypothetical protein [Verrucomicrobiaceae bacterium]
MKLILSVLSVAALLFGSVSCDSHSFEKTKSLHENMHEGEHGEHAKEEGKAAHEGEHPAAAADEHKAAKEH